MGVEDDEKNVGAAERAARYRQYEYKANASLVLQADKTERRMHEPSGMPESLWGRIDAKAFGDRAGNNKKRDATKKGRSEDEEALRRTKKKK